MRQTQRAAYPKYCHMSLSRAQGCPAGLPLLAQCAPSQPFSVSLGHCHHLALQHIPDQPRPASSGQHRRCWKHSSREWHNLKTFSGKNGVR